MDERHVISFSGGKDSAAMLLRMHELSMQIDEVIFVDNGWEFPEMIKTFEIVRERLPYKFTLLDLRERFNYLFYEHVIGSGRNVGRKLGFPSKKRPYCVRDKGRAIDKYVKALAPETFQYLGFAWDEKHRTMRSEIKKVGRNFHFPLIEWKWTEEKCLDYCYEQGIDFDGFYQKFKRGGCWCCPMQPLSSLRKLRKHYPDLWEKLLAMQEFSHNSFRIEGTTVFDLDKRFTQEDKQGKFNWNG